MQVLRMFMLRAMQRFIRRHAQDEFGGEKTFLYGRSVANQRIEGWWAFLRKSETDWWINYFKDLRDQGLYDGTDPVHVECLRFCFLPQSTSGRVGTCSKTLESS